jgi:hypothetical protein
VDAAPSEDREEEGVEDGKDTEDGEGNADIGYYISCAGHCERGRTCPSCCSHS